MSFGVGPFNPEDFEKMTGKTEPNAEVRQLAAFAWSVFTAFKDEGFSEPQAIELVSDIITTSIGNS